MQESGCRWCPETQNCHDEGSVMDQCSIPINSEGQCWGQYCAYQLGELLNHRADDAKAWMSQTAAHQADPLMPFPTYSPGVTGIFDLATGAPLTDKNGGSPVTDYIISAIADWGSGTCAAKVVGKIAAAEKPQMTIHMGDVYFVATPEQYQTNILGKAKNQYQQGVAFPKGSVITYLQMGNHELISGCKGLYVDGFSYTGQQTTYAAWQTDSWRIISLDTGRLCYSSHMGVRDVEFGTTDAPLPDEVVDWLVNTVQLGDPNDKRGILLLSHHQPYDAFSTSYMGAANQLNKILPKGKQVLWLYGHDHMLALYKKMQLEGTDFVIYPRLIGIGGFPNILASPKKTDGLVAYDFRTYQAIPDDDGNAQNVGFNGYAKLTITGNKLDISYITASCTDNDCTKGLSETDPTTVAFETFEADLSTGQVEQTYMTVGPQLTKVSEPADEVASVSCIPQSAFADYDATLNHYD